jgi:hypothetical protein
MEVHSPAAFDRNERSRPMVTRRDRTHRRRDESNGSTSNLGRDLLALRAEIVASGVPLLSWDEVEKEVRVRRGGVDSDDDADVR